MPPQGEYLVSNGKDISVAYLDTYYEWIPSNVGVTNEMSSVFLDMTVTYWAELPELPEI